SSSMPASVANSSFTNSKILACGFGEAPMRMVSISPLAVSPSLPEAPEAPESPAALALSSESEPQAARDRVKAATTGKASSVRREFFNMIFSFSLVRGDLPRGLRQVPCVLGGMPDYVGRRRPVVLGKNAQILGPSARIFGPCGPGGRVAGIN